MHDIEGSSGRVAFPQKDETGQEPVQLRCYNCRGKDFDPGGYEPAGMPALRRRYPAGHQVL